MSITTMYLGCLSSNRCTVPTRKPQGGNVTQMGRPGLKCRSAEPPPAAAYQFWLDHTLSSDRRARHKITGEKLRRAVWMVRNGYSRKEASEAVGVKSTSDFIAKLPPELAP